MRKWLPAGLALATTSGILALAAGCGRGEETWVRIVPTNPGALSAAAEQPVSAGGAACPIPFFLRAMGPGIPPKRFSFRATLDPTPIVAASPGVGVAAGFQSPAFLIPQGPGRILFLRGFVRAGCDSGVPLPAIGVAGPVDIQGSGDIPMEIRFPSSPLKLTTAVPVSAASSYYKYIDLQGASPPNCGTSVGNTCKVISLRDIEADFDLAAVPIACGSGEGCSGSTVPYGNLNLGPLAPDTEYEIKLEHYNAGNTPAARFLSFVLRTPPPFGPVSTSRDVDNALFQ